MAFNSPTMLLRQITKNRVTRSLLSRQVSFSTRTTSLTRITPHLGKRTTSPPSSFRFSPLPFYQQQRSGHTVRIILTSDLPEGNGYEGDIMTVRAGYARNYLIPGKMALYATPENFSRLGIVDTETEEKTKQKEIIDDDMGEASEDQKAADLLNNYLKNKILKIWRNSETGGIIHPGMIDANAVRSKLSKQLKIDLEDHERVQIHPNPVSFLEVEEDMESFLGEQMVDWVDEKTNNDIQINKLGDYIAKIHLAGGFTAPLRFTVVKR